MFGAYDLKLLESRILSKTTKTESCWIWNGYTERNGYGRITVNDKPYSTHRLSFLLFKGELKENLVIDHSCRNRACLNPEHLRQVTQRENCHENSRASCHLNSLKTHCPKGHEYTEENTKTKTTKYGVGRACKECARAYARSKYVKRQPKEKIERTACPQGHDYNESNTYVSLNRNGTKVKNCRACRTTANRKYKQKAKVAKW